MPSTLISNTCSIGERRPSPCSFCAASATAATLVGEAIGAVVVGGSVHANIAEVASTTVVA
jgi:hypothetical protein